MDEALLSYYNRELTYIRTLGADFADQHPKIAGRLRLDKDVVEDPHVSRLIESFAFLTARIRHTLDDSFPELTEALMGILYPDYHAPIPSMSIIKVSLLKELTEKRVVPEETLIATESTPLGVCYYRAIDNTEVLPVNIKKTQFMGQPYKAPALPADFNVKLTANQSMMQITLECEEGITFSELSPSSLRFYVNGQPQHTYKLYELLVSGVMGMAIAEHANDPNAVFLPASSLRPCSLTDYKETIPTDGRTSVAHNLLTEYFTFPERFLFVEMDGLEDCWAQFENKVNLYIYFNRSDLELVQGVSDTSMLLGCVPVVNLFEQAIEGIPADQVGIEKKLSVDATHTNCADVHTVKRVYARSSDGKCIDLKPFYGSHRNPGDNQNMLYWNIRRESSQWHNGRISHGTDSYISFVDPNYQVIAPDSDWIINADVLCTNRDLPDKLPFGPDNPDFYFVEGGAGLRIKCLTAPTSTIQPKLNEATRWQLITQLSMQHFTGEGGLQVLKETLNLYNFRQSAETRSLIDGIVDMKTGVTTARLKLEGRAAICQGTEITLEFDEYHYSGSGLYLFAEILSEFFAQYCTINTFVQLNVKVKQRPGQLIEWPPRNGKQVLL